MKNMMRYKGYYGSVEFSAEDELFCGKLAFIRDLVLFEAEDAKGLVRAFHQAVDDYLDLCTEQGRQPETPFKGSFNIRPGRELHARAALLARQRDLPLNALVSAALADYLDRA